MRILHARRYMIGLFAMYGCDYESPLNMPERQRSESNRTGVLYLMDPHGKFGSKQQEKSDDQMKSDLEKDYDEFTAKLKLMRSDMRLHTHALISEYEDFLKGLVQLSRVQSALHAGAVYMNTIRIIPFNFTQPEPGEIAKGAFIGNGELHRLKASLIQVIESYMKEVTGSSLLDRLKSMKERLTETDDQIVTLEIVSSTAADLNSLLPELHATMAEAKAQRATEVWIDTSGIADPKERRKLIRFVIGERKRGDHPNSNTAIAELPSLFSLTVHRSSGHNFLRIFRDFTSNQTKVIGVCGSRFKSPYLFSFTCASASRSISLLGEASKANKLAKAVLKVACNSKSLARYLVMSPDAREDRCFLSRWPGLAAKAGTEFAKRRKFDRRGKRAFEMLANGDGCFAKEEIDIEIDCLGKKRES